MNEKIQMKPFVLISLIFVLCACEERKDVSASTPSKQTSSTAAQEPVLIESKLSEALKNCQNVKIRLIGDSVTWGAGASDTASSTPRSHSLDDARNNFTSPTWANHFVDWVGQNVTVNNVNIDSGKITYDYCQGNSIVIENDGINGTWSGQWLPSGSLLDNGTDYDHVIVMMGLNDRGRAGSSKQVSKDNLTEIVDFYKQKGSEVILMSYLPISSEYDHPDNQAYSYSAQDIDEVIRDVAEEKQIILVDNFMNGEFDETLISGMNPSDEGHQVIFDNLIRHF